MATHSSILAWEISWTEEPGGPQDSDTTEGLNIQTSKPPLPLCIEIYLIFAYGLLYPATFLELFFDVAISL